jgi:uncharacterized membrane protein YkoI
MTRRRIWGIGAALALAAAAAIAITAGVTLAGGGDDSEGPITGDALERASAAALAHTGEGRVTETEVGDEESLYEVEVTLDDGRQVDVQLDANFNVVGSEDDSVGEDDEGGADDD